MRPVGRAGQAEGSGGGGRGGRVRRRWEDREIGAEVRGRGDVHSAHMPRHGDLAYRGPEKAVLVLVLVLARLAVGLLLLLLPLIMVVVMVTCWLRCAAVIAVPFALETWIRR